MSRMICFVIAQPKPLRPEKPEILYGNVFLRRIDVQYEGIFENSTRRELQTQETCLLNTIFCLFPVYIGCPWQKIPLLFNSIDTHNI